MIGKFLYRGFSPYYYIRKCVFILRNWSEFRQRKQFNKPSDLALVKTIQEEGWTILSLDPQRVGELAAYCRSVEQDNYPQDTPPNSGPGKDFWVLLVNRGNIGEHKAIVEFASQARLKDMASTYLGEEAVLSEIALMKSFPTGREIKHSQLWHLDADDHKLLLFYVYCRDVDEETGPFVLARKSGMKLNFMPRFFRKYGFTDAEIQQQCAPNSIVSVVGREGTVFACDTAQAYHHGSRCLSKTRLALSIRYTTFSGLYPVQPITLAN